MANRIVYILLIVLCPFRIIFGQDYKKLQKQLEDIGIEDQKYRSQSDSIRTQFGSNSEQYKALWKLQHYQDSINKIAITKIVDKYGWINQNEIGNEAAYVLFSVILHSDLKTQEKYLPIIRKAVKEKKARGQNLAMLEDKVALNQGKKQIYGTQILQDEKTKEYYFAPIEDPKNIDKRRNEMGMGLLAEDYNTIYYNIVWNPKTYKQRK
jgi:hypothetical protein